MTFQPFFLLQFGFVYLHCLLPSSLHVTENGLAPQKFHPFMQMDIIIVSNFGKGISKLNLHIFDNFLSCRKEMAYKSQPTREAGEVGANQSPKL